MRHHITAVFARKSDSVRVLDELRLLGLSDERLSIVVTHHEDGENGDSETIVDHVIHGQPIDVDPILDSAGKGLLAGASLGALFSLSAIMLPGVGPMLVAGTLATTLAALGTGALAGAVMGTASGSLAGAFIKAGYPENDSHFYVEALQEGDVLISVDLDDSEMPEFRVRDVFARNAGRQAPILV